MKILTTGNVWGRQEPAGATLYKIIGNFCIHESCWNQLIQGCTTFEEVLYKIAEKRQPAASNQDKPNAADVEVVKTAIRNLGFVITKETKNRLYFRKPGTRGKVAPLFYDKRFRKFEFTGQANGLLDGFILRRIFEQIQSEVTRLKEEKLITIGSS
ncbi:hypothetical protein JK635_07555 [Neobacillus sp. YIM B02564]|uniref:Uncharacterized protein n=1 Tax=Neobacillus paridis TaxID=2803862 RepID=A0ABS1TMV2_9BACI|nr:hypothetical protein [Neobacillus paridis]MBL4952064.1 hypothetical protein [Neobacillus paridis]